MSIRSAVTTRMDPFFSAFSLPKVTEVYDNIVQITYMKQLSRKLTAGKYKISVSKLGVPYVYELSFYLDLTTSINEP